jgi:hypothetical protein
MIWLPKKIRLSSIFQHCVKELKLYYTFKLDPVENYDIMNPFPEKLNIFKTYKLSTLSSLITLNDYLMEIAR